ncbi:MAG: hypothetical protein BJBARM5_0305 [Candidatus Parvarchaeum acidophilus ARMAN-5]|jgi:hypothetical protein|uniref:Uncharacterized protein n=1 Tax=Candidatus Parvarchaeum acidophilus ARMAN-5 TaxID=662762 RepID=D6GV05_PARA5|nr:MAG: hypothetical protein BJBARM5_0305 [Candidatus Parvarchaeum acidophilus ARMAN-5]
MEAVWYYIIAIILGITLVLVYIFFVGPSALSKDISSFFSGILSPITNSFKSVS